MIKNYNKGKILIYCSIIFFINMALSDFTIGVLFSFLAFAATFILFPIGVLGAFMVERFLFGGYFAYFSIATLISFSLVFIFWQVVFVFALSGPEKKEKIKGVLVSGSLLLVLVLLIAWRLGKIDWVG